MPVLPSETEDTSTEPSTWTVLSILVGSVWLSWSVYSTARQIWQWIQQKIEAHDQKKLAQDEANPELEQLKAQIEKVNPMSGQV
jgi:hypothetical protein